jgi:hypothetical protein
MKANPNRMMHANHPTASNPKMMMMMMMMNPNHGYPATGGNNINGGGGMQGRNPNGMRAAVVGNYPASYPSYAHPVHQPASHHGPHYYHHPPVHLHRPGRRTPVSHGQTHYYSSDSSHSSNGYRA